MKHFAYSFSEGKASRDGSGVERTIRLYRIVRNTPEFLIEVSASYLNEWQLVMDGLEKVKALPQAAFARNPGTGALKYKSAWALKEAGIASVTAL